MQSDLTQLIYRLDKANYFPHYEELEKLYRQVYLIKKTFSGYGPGGVFDDVIQWVKEASSRLSIDPKTIPTDLVIPNLTSSGKRAERYRELFLEAAISLLRLLPRGLIDLFPVMSKGDAIVFLLTFTGRTFLQHEIVASFRVEDFCNTTDKRGRSKVS
ncbi:hypothetical protein AVT69_gp043 [Pseudomonas phage PhiPA3]|uniref:Uncharacterized protein 042 n=1 Tax=Pseudomonas phage PhiPA3 TaxID=998086 RepID=F8SJS4_BPPA3|nr:hypothetical protein AVT69_gp043 [Pseudomonas phage PhiPA3]AEH03469.1 hypothetical protein [Pseudomonas phage PhiPA3]